MKIIFDNEAEQLEFIKWHAVGGCPSELSFKDDEEICRMQPKEINFALCEKCWRNALTDVMEVKP